MKKIIVTILLGVLLLTACQQGEKKETKVKQTSEKPQQIVENKQATTFPYPNLLAEDDKSYSLLMIGEQDKQTPIEKNKKITKEVKYIMFLRTLDEVQKNYPDLHIESGSAYILFNNQAEVHQSKNLKDLTSYLDANSTKK